MLLFLAGEFFTQREAVEQGVKVGFVFRGAEGFTQVCDRAVRLEGDRSDADGGIVVARIPSVDAA